jgi:phosphate transport system substrate-binding protein
MGKEHIAPTALTYESNGAVRELVNNDPCAIGYMSLGMVKDANVKPLKIDGVVPSAQGVRNGTYRLSRPFLFVMKHEPNAVTKAYIDFVKSPAGQKMLEDEGLTVLGQRAGSVSDGANQPARLDGLAYGEALPQTARQWRPVAVAETGK